MFNQIFLSSLWQTVAAIILIISTATVIIASIGKSQRPPKAKMLLNLITICLAILLIVGTGWASYVFSLSNQSFTSGPISAIAPSSPTSTSYRSTPLPPFPNPTPTAHSSGTILYNANWSKGSDGWIAGSTAGGWSISNGMLNNSGSMIDNPILLAQQIQSPSTNYTVDAKIQDSADNSGNYAFGIIVGSDGNSDGYACYLIGSENQSANIATVDNVYSQNLEYAPPLRQVLEPVNTDFHTYSVEVRGTQIVFLIDDQKPLHVSSTIDLSLQKIYVGLIDNNAAISVSNFKVTSF